MRTKEEILEDFDYDILLKENMDIVCFDAAIKAMDEYAKEVAVAFAEWTNIKDYVYDIDKRLWWYNDSTPEYTTEQLFDIFLSEQQTVKK